MRRLFTSESVTEGHPDKLCDYISDSILDAYLAQDPYSRVACETVAGKGQILVTGEITSNGKVDIEKIVRDTIKTKNTTNIMLTKVAFCCKIHTLKLKILSRVEERIGFITPQQPI